MGFIYQIKVNNELYIGSTTQKLLSYRQREHNYSLRNQNHKYNNTLYKFCRKHNVEKIICELIEEVNDNELVLLEQEYINMLEPSLNTNKAYQTTEKKIEYYKNYNKIKSNCPICNKTLLKRNIDRHIKSKH